MSNLLYQRKRKRTYSTRIRIHTHTNFCLRYLEKKTLPGYFTFGNSGFMPLTSSPENKTRLRSFGILKHYMQVLRLSITPPFRLICFYEFRGWITNYSKRKLSKCFFTLQKKLRNINIINGAQKLPANIIISKLRSSATKTKKNKSKFIFPFKKGGR